MEDQAKVNVGIIGCGTISSIYLQAPAKFALLRIVACADLIPEVAQAKARQYGVPKVALVEELLSDPEIDLVLNLTVPAAHTEIGLAALAAGKAASFEKALGNHREEGKAPLATAPIKQPMGRGAPRTLPGGGPRTRLTLTHDVARP